VGGLEQCALPGVRLLEVAHFRGLLVYGCLALDLMMFLCDLLPDDEIRQQL
jgi:hypothetical protein